MARGKAVVFAVAAMAIAIILPARADLVATGFEQPAYQIGSIHNQDGWRAPGAHDQMVTRNGNNYPGFGLQSFRISNAVTSGGYDDQVISKPTLNEVGETDAVGGGFSGGTRVRRFDATLSFGSFREVWQPGLSIGIAPDRGDGTPMSLLRIRDQAEGIELQFTDYVSGSAADGCSKLNFRVRTAAVGLTRLSTHDLRLVYDVHDGPRNDVVLVYVNDALRLTGTTWEDAYRECGGSQPPTVDSLNINAVEGPCTACDGMGVVIDNLAIRAIGPVLFPKALEIAEGGPSKSYAVRLETPPLDFVRVVPQVPAGVTITPAELVFTPSNFSVPQSFFVSAVDDTVPENPEIVLIRHTTASFDGHWDGVPVDSVRVRINDNDAPYVLSETDGVTVVSEQGPTSDSYSFRLFTQPAADVTITASPDAQVTVGPASRTFTPANWNVPQSFIVTAVDDAIDEADGHEGLVTHTATSADPDYNGSPPTVTATVFDNDPVPPGVPAPVITNCPPGPITSRSYTFTGTTQVNTAIEMYIDGAVAGGVLPDFAGNWSLNLTFPGNGTFAVTARATDINGNRSPFSAPCSVTVSADVTPPPVPTLVTPAENAVTGPTVTVSGDAFGDTVQVRLFDAGAQIATVAAMAGPWQTTLTFASGAHSLTARAVDAAGNISAASPVRTFTADGEPPVVTFTSPPLGFLIQPVLPFGPWRIEGFASDTHSGIARMEVQAENLLTGATSIQPLACACPSSAGAVISWGYDPPVFPGIYRITVRAVDKLGNVGSAARVVLLVS
ncbi:MAG TPA: Ig-like domain-containing protein [Actinomycetota bacterium]